MFETHIMWVWERLCQRLVTKKHTRVCFRRRNPSQNHICSVWWNTCLCSLNFIRISTEWKLCFVSFMTIGNSISMWWCHVSNVFLFFTPTWGRFPFWLIFFQGGWNHQPDDYWELYIFNESPNRPIVCPPNCQVVCSCAPNSFVCPTSYDVEPIYAWHLHVQNPLVSRIPSNRQERGWGWSRFVFCWGWISNSKHKIPWTSWPLFMICFFFG